MDRCAMLCPMPFSGFARITQVSGVNPGHELAIAIPILSLCTELSDISYNVLYLIKK